VLIQNIMFSCAAKKKRRFFEKKTILVRFETFHTGAAIDVKGGIDTKRENEQSSAPARKT
jgi:hypothetical protein